jgi:hypothetical protein
MAANSLNHPPISRLLLAFVATWAFAESAFWFVAVDFLLIPFSITYPKQWFKTTLVAWIASHCGGTIYFFFCRENLELAGTILATTPFVTPRMHRFIIELYDTHGPWGALAQAWSFMSFKIWTYEAVKHGFSFVPFFPIVMFSRVFRLFVVSWISAKTAPLLRPIWLRNKAIAWALYTVFFISMLVIIEK